MDKLDSYILAPDQYKLHPSEVANLLKELPESLFQEYIKKLPTEIIGDVALELPGRYFGDIVEAIPTSEIAEAVTELESHDQTDFMQELEEVDQDLAESVFEILDQKSQDEITKLKSYTEDEAGSFMQVEVFTASKGEVVKDVIQRFARLKKDNKLENTNYLFIIDKQSKLLYKILLEDLLTFDFSEKFENIIELNPDKYGFKSVEDHDDISNVVKLFVDHDFIVVPVLDGFGKLVGRITSGDVYDIINDQATEQIYHLAGVNDEAEENNNFKTIARSRAPWLFINLFTAMLASIVIGLFQESLKELVALAVLMPIVSSIGGNAGMQSLTVVVRQLSLGEIGMVHAKKIILRELFASIINGLIFAVIIGLVAYVWFNNSGLGLVIFLSMIFNLILAGLSGATIPLILKHLGFDPAIGSSVVLTAITDIFGFLSFLGLAKLML